MTTTKTKLNEIVSNMKDKGNPSAIAVETAVNNLVTEKLDKIIKGAKAVSDAIGVSVGSIDDVAHGGAAGVGIKADEASVKSVIEGICNIVDIVLQCKGDAEAGDDKKTEDGNSARSTNAGEAGKLFANAAVGSATAARKSAADAVKALGAVTGADILRAIAQG
ncbi:Variable outer membrane protein (plasmid) [Borrelia coriaceae ATCC 43381]|uniref:Variable large protein n=1 Tax=Borrelia coriaceae ATCC 43381 TaxID=1408429 RepID=W5SWE5_9SPIR|nr:Variable outer membrane protein [Borrelia coriaceae ATCC 43381]